MTGGEPAATGQNEEANERLLVEAAQADPARFADLYEINFERVFAYVARRVQDRDLAEDLTSEVFQKALANLSRWRWRGAPFAAWLFRISANAIADRFRQAGKEQPLGEPGTTSTSEREFEAAERRAHLYRLVSQLPDDQRQVIALRFAEEKSIKEIAVVLERSEGAIKQLQFRGLRNLRKQLDETNG